MSKTKKTCGSCLYFDHTKLPGEPKLHKDMGHQPFGKPCRSYEVNPFPLITCETSKLDAVAEVVNSLDKRQKQILANLITASDRLPDYGLKFRQVVFYQWRGGPRDQYLNNFCKAYIMSVSLDGSEVRITDEKAKLGVQCNRRSIFTVDEFEKIKTRMVRNAKLHDPNFSKSPKKHLRTNLKGSMEKVSRIEDVLTSVAADFLPKIGFLSLTPAERRALRERNALLKSEPKAKGRKGSGDAFDVTR